MQCGVVRSAREKSVIVGALTTVLLLLGFTTFFYVRVQRTSKPPLWRECLARCRRRRSRGLVHPMMRSPDVRESQKDGEEGEGGPSRMDTLIDQIRVLVTSAQIFSSFNLSFSGSANATSSGSTPMMLPPAVLHFCSMLEFMSLNVADLMGKITPCDTSLTFSAKLALWCLALPTTCLVIGLSFLEVRRRVVRRIADAAQRSQALEQLTDLAVCTTCSNDSIACALCVRY